MSLVINTNIASLNAQNNLSTSQSQLDQAIAQLSSGLQINSPADNPAGYAIAQQMTAQINGFNQAASNANDGISFAQVANGALSTITNSLQSIRTLALQSANATNSPQDRQALNSEVEQAIAQVNTTAQNTQFNGQNILNGSSTSLVFQVGANANQTITATAIDARGQSLGATYGDGASVLTNTLSATGTSLGSITVSSSNGSTTQSASIDLTGVTSVAGAVAAINNASSSTGVYAQRDQTTTAVFQVSGASNAISVSGASLTLNGVQISLSSGATSADVVNAVNSVSSQTGVTAVSGTGGNFYLTNNSGGDITVKFSASGQIEAYKSTDTSGTATQSVTGSAGVTYSAGIQLYTAVNSSVKVTQSGTAGSGAQVLGLTSGANTLKVVNGSTTSYNQGVQSSSTITQSSQNVFNGSGSIGSGQATLTLNSTNVSTEASSQLAIMAMDFALQQMSSFGGELGALQSRFQATISNLQSASQNTQAARSRIQDANFAAATAQLSRAQVLQQAGVAMVAQANSDPQVALTLLK